MASIARYGASARATGSAKLALPAEAGRRHSCHHLRAKVVAGRVCATWALGFQLPARVEVELYASSPRRFKACIDADGGPTGY